MSVVLATALASVNAAAQEGDVVAFVGANVITMEDEQLLENQTVLVQGDRIVEIGAADAVAVPEGAVVIDATGRYLIPGLVDVLPLHPIVTPNAIELGELARNAAEAAGDTIDTADVERCLDRIGRVTGAPVIVTLWASTTASLRSTTSAGRPTSARQACSNSSSVVFRTSAVNRSATTVATCVPLS